HIAVEIARGLRIAHRAGIIHRDLKPGNVMVLGDEENVSRVKILDFGLVKSVVGEERESLTQAGVFVGSPAYMSPEQIRSKSTVDRRTDIYSLGVILDKWLSGKPPFEGDQLNVMMSPLNAPVPTLRERNPQREVPPALQDLVLRMMAKEPDERPPSVDH